MHCDLQHVHLFASDLAESIRFYHEMFGTEILFDEIVADVRNVLIRIGTGHINFSISLRVKSGKVPCIISESTRIILPHWSLTWR